MQPSVFRLRVFYCGELMFLDKDIPSLPAQIKAIEGETKTLGFEMASDYLTGSLLRTLVASKPAGKFLEIGTGTGLATAWMLSGMDEKSTLLTVDKNPAVTAIAEKYLGNDSRLDIRTQDGLVLLEELQGKNFDLIFADTWPGKLKNPELALNLLRAGSFYVIDDMRNLNNLPEKVAGISQEVLQQIPKQMQSLIEVLEARADLITTKLLWSTGIMICTKIK